MRLIYLSSQTTLLSFISSKSNDELHVTKKEKSSLQKKSKPQEKRKSNERKNIVIDKMHVEYNPKNTPPCILLDVDYDGREEKAFLKLYDPKNNRLYIWYDTTNHHPYCLTDIPKEEVERNKAIIGHPSYLGAEEVEKFDLLNERPITMTKILARDPLAIGGTRDAIREKLKNRAWEAHIPYRKSYIMDRNLVPGAFYIVKGGSLLPVSSKVTEQKYMDILPYFEKEYKENIDLLNSFIELFFTEIPSLTRVAMDIEVLSPALDIVPDPNKAEHQVIAVSFSAKNGLKEIHVLRRSDIPEGNISLPPEVDVIYYDDEKELIKTVFERIKNIPILITFNGDNFDLKYLYNRAIALGFPHSEIPITKGKDVMNLKFGVHIDLYPFFHNRSINVYAFSMAYKDASLDAISKAILGKGKVELDKEIFELDLKTLAYYCYMDSEITYELTSYNDDLVMKMIILIMRISKMTIIDVTRQNISAWIRNMIYYEHRRNGYLIPRPEDILREKGQTSTKAIIKGKKYMGAIVVSPKAGIHFNVVVVDFASLYPSLIKQWNLSYETIRCHHPECRENRIPKTNHWVCTKRKGLTSVIVGLLRDLRIKWFKPKSKDKSIPESQRSTFKVIGQVLKVFINATYGVFGSEHFPLYCPPLAESTAALGRYSIEETYKKAEEMGMIPLYGDTDSLFILNPTRAQIDDLIKWSTEYLGIDLEIDKVYKWVALSSRKKNYLGLLQDGSIDVKGLLGKKRNTPEFCKKTFKSILDVLQKVETRDEFESAKKKILKIIQESYNKLEASQYSLQDLAIKVQLSKSLKEYTKTTPQHVKAALLLEQNGKRVVPGQIVHYVKTVTPPGVKPVELAKLSEIDIAKYKDYLRTTLEQVLDALEIDFETVSGVSQISSWFD
ncbi:MAG: DNA-directed DNA polymerase I [Candidatus Odinarchaeota archaeon]|nr:DNA-directed DNA polymerase I [Candidatus Odinarchaeota archaeon]